MDLLVLSVHLSQTISLLLVRNWSPLKTDKNVENFFLYEIVIK